MDANGVVYACTYIPTLTLAGSRLVAHGMCATSPKICNHVHLSRARARGDVASGGAQWSGFCQKTSDDGGRTWSRIRKILDQPYPMPGATQQLGMVVWDDRTKTLLLQYPSPDVHQITSTDLGESW